MHDHLPGGSNSEPNWDKAAVLWGETCVTLRKLSIVGVAST